MRNSYGIWELVNWECNVLEGVGRWFDWIVIGCIVLMLLCDVIVIDYGRCNERCWVNVNVIVGMLKGGFIERVVNFWKMGFKYICLYFFFGILWI